ncbi:MAG TPA: hypothetical protein PKJ23_14505 [bacterium]|nr:hypothetical protein [bacterium]
MGDSYTLLDILIRLGLEDLQELARRSGSIASPSRRSLSAQVLAQYRDRNFIRKIVRALPKEAMGLLGFLVLLQDQSRQGLQGRTQWEDYPEHTQHLDALLHAGLLFRFPDENSEPIIPEEIIPAIRDTLLELEQNEPSVQEERLWGGTERILLMQFRLLAAVQKGRFRQNPGNGLGKRELEQWLSELPNDVFPPNSVPNMIDPQAVADSLLDAGLQSGLIDRWKGELRITNEILGWLREDRGTLRKGLWTRFVHSVVIRYQPGMSRCSAQYTGERTGRFYGKSHPHRQRGIGEPWLSGCRGSALSGSPVRREELSLFALLRPLPGKRVKMRSPDREPFSEHFSPTSS